MRSLASAFLMYSRIPVPKVAWKEENRRYALCFFPLIGAVIGCLLILWTTVCDALHIGSAVRSAVSVIIPVLVTGGIHIDGFCDTADALASYADRQKRLEIMSDPHTGSFAMIRLCVMFLLQFSFFCEVRNVCAAAVGYVISRALSGLAAVTLRSAKSGGTLQAFVKPAHRSVSIAALSVILILCTAGLCITDPFAGITACSAAALCFLIYTVMAYRNFGGITGDTEGWFLQVTETAVLAAIFTAEKITEVLL